MSIRCRHALAVMVMAAGLGGCADRPGPTATASDAAPRLSRQQGVVPGQYVVVFHDHVADPAGLARRLAGAHGGRIRHVYRHALRGFAANLSPAAAEALGRNPNVKYVAQDATVRVAQWPLGAFWGQDRVSQRDLPLDDIIKFNRSGSGVTIYVLDTGIQTSHSEFGGRASVGYDALGGNGQDCHGHGTHVAGIAGGGTWGVAKEATLVAVRVLDCNGDGDWSDVIAGIDWVRTNHATKSVANLSLRGSGYAPVDTALMNMISAGVPATVAAGNDYGDACSYSPARVATALTVGAVDSTDTQAAFSNDGSCLDLYAPGVNIRSSWIGSTDSLESGTSMAAPYVAGAAALYLQGVSSATASAVNSAVLGNASSNKLSGLGLGSPNVLLHAIIGRWPIHRLHNSGNGDHMYSWFPYEGLFAGYWPETQNYFYIEANPASGHTALYRCYQSWTANSNHLLTTSSNCEGATSEGIRGYIATSQLTGTVPLYRLYKSSIPNDVYTISGSEVTTLQGAGYTLVGTTGYVYTSAW